MIKQLSIACFAALAISACAVARVDNPPSVCITHSQVELEQGLACDNGPDCGFDANHDPVPIEQSPDVASVCHCIGGRYACFGIQPTLTRNSLWQSCGFHNGVDAGQCTAGLECFGVCTFECGAKYTLQSDGTYIYMVDPLSSDLCSQRGGSCKDSLGVGINICSQEK